MKKAIAYNEGESEFWYVCTHSPKCNTYYNSFKPLPHQAAVLSDNHKFILNAGGFGSAKTYATRQLIYKQIFMSPGNLILVCANVSSQYKNTIQKELEADIPKAFVRSFNKMDQMMTLVNGSSIIYRPLDDVDKLRSLNLGAFFMIEGSEVDKEAFTQLKSRLRNMKAAKQAGVDATGKIIYKHFRGHGIIETNPDNGWIKTELLDCASAIKQHGTAHADYEPNPDKADPAISAHISSSDSNIYLPDGYIEDLCRNKPTWWVNRYIYGSFEFGEGLVVPNYRQCIVSHFRPEKSWVKLVAHDPGIADPAAFLCAAVDDVKGEVHIYRDNQWKDCNLKTLADHWIGDVSYDIDPTEYYTQPILDPKFYGRKQYNDDLSTYDQMWMQYGVHFQPGHVNILDAVLRINTYVESGRLKIHDNCSFLIEELKNWKWSKRTLENTGVQKPEDGNDHSISCLRWILCKLPEDPQRLMMGAYTGFGTEIQEGKKKTDQQKLFDWYFSDNEPKEEDFVLMEGDY